MTGLEGVAGVAGAAAKKVISDDPQVDGTLLDVAKDNGDLARAAKVRARRAEMLEVVKYRLVQPLGWLFRASSYFEDQFEEDMATRLDDVPPEEVTTPPTSIAAPIVQGISHTIDEPELRNLYLNLLASASDLRTAESAHPAFAHVIDQMTSFEAQALAKVLGPALLGAYYTAAARIQLYANAEESVASSHRVAVHCITQLEAVSDDPVRAEHLTERLGVYYVNWQRLGLVEIDFSRYPAGEHAFDWVVDHPLYAKVVREHTEAARVDFEKGMLGFTNFGVEFARTVLPSNARALDGEVVNPASSSTPPTE
ncbi:DUF4393 domain-containing protein [Rhodococcus sp. ENV425]|uniref:DUF4393 domain-containing protein n=1 Tax=Rhodococcus sp. ENV425 TaxID=2042960 RepID=UPI0015E0C568|nr:DUF4393 domain-containing protein [Rhodococcus sp. ENV425]